MNRRFLLQKIQTALMFCILIAGVSACAGTTDLGLSSIMGGAGQAETVDAAATDEAEEDEVYIDAQGSEIPVADADEVLTEELTEVWETSGDSADGSGSRAQATDEALDDDGASLEEITVADLPVTFPKEDESPTDTGDTEECNAENVEAISLVLSDSDGTRRMPVGRMRPFATFGVNALATSILQNDGDETSEPSGAERVYFLPRTVLTTDSDDTELRGYTCSPIENEDGSLSYGWIESEASDFTEIEIELGAVRLSKRSVILSEQAAILGFTGRSSRFRLSREDFALSEDENDMIPYVILRPASF